MLDESPQRDVAKLFDESPEIFADSDSETVSSNKSIPKAACLKKPLFISVFKNNQNNAAGFALSRIELDDEIEFELDEVDDPEDAWGGFCLVGYFASRFPGVQALKQLCNKWGVEYEYYNHHLGWIVLKFGSTIDRDNVLNGGPYSIFGRTLMLKLMPDYFELDDSVEISFVPVWVKLQALPVQFWNEKALSKIAYRVGNPISTDLQTQTKDRLGYARILVEVDASKSLVESVKLKLPNDINAGKPKSQKAKGKEQGGGGDTDFPEANSKSVHTGEDAPFKEARKRKEIRKGAQSVGLEQDLGTHGFLCSSDPLHYHMRNLWNNLSNFGVSLTSPCLVLGDFNCVLSPEEKCNGLDVSSYQVRDMVGCFLSFEIVGTRDICSPIDDNALRLGLRVSEEQAQALIKEVTILEIRLALLDIGDDKFPGLDGFSSYFFKQVLDFVGEDLCDAVKEYFRFSFLLKQINHTLLAMVPKFSHSSSVGDFRPIACCNVMYKVITKILVAILAPILEVIIDQAQSVFIGGRNITDNIHIAQGLLRMYNRKRISPRCMIKVDLRDGMCDTHLLLYCGEWRHPRHVHWAKSMSV